MINISGRPADKKRFLKAISKEPYQEVSYFETEISPCIMSRILGKKVDCRTYFLDPEDHLALLSAAGIDMAYLCFPWFEGRKWHVDEYGRRHYIDGMIKCREDIGNIKFPQLDAVKRRIEGFMDAAEGTGTGLVYALNGAHDIIASIGFQDYYTKLYDDPLFIEDFMDIYEEKVVYPVMDIVFGYKPDAVMLGCELCYKEGMMISPEMAERFVFRRMRRQMELIRSAGIPAILHSDGDNTSVIDEWIRIGFSAMHPIENCGRYDIFEVKEKWGDKIALIGNIDIAGVLVSGTPREVEEDTMKHLEALSAGGGYICGSSHDINEDVPIENLAAMIRTVCGYRRETV